MREMPETVEIQYRPGAWASQWARGPLRVPASRGGAADLRVDQQLEGNPRGWSPKYAGIARRRSRSVDAR